MKRIFILTLFAGLAITILQGQDAMKQFSDSMCECLKKKPGAFADQTSMQNAMIECQGSMMTEMFAVMQEKGISDPSDTKALTQLGLELSEVLMSNCPTFKDGVIAMQMGSSQMGSKGEPSNAVQEFNGTLIDRIDDTVSRLKIRTTDGEIMTLYWLGTFSGERELRAESANFMNKKVVFSYIEKELYDPVINQYKIIKEIHSLRLL